MPLARQHVRWPTALHRAGPVVLVVVALCAVVWVRLRPFALPGLEAQAEAQVRGTLAAVRGLDDAGVEAWIARNPARFARKVASNRERLASQLTYRAEDGRAHVYLGDYDSYLWLRRARQYLRAGTTCDAVASGDCRDLYTLAPTGRSMRYARSIHIAAMVAVHRIATWLEPGWPLPSSAMLVPVIVGALGVLPAFALGRRLAGNAGGLVAAIVAGTNPVFLARSIGSDDDVWHVVLPLAVVWAVAAALAARGTAARVGLAAGGAVLAAVHAMSWRGALLTWAVAAGGLAATFVVYAARWFFPARRATTALFLRRAGTVLVVFWGVGGALAVMRGEGAAFLRMPVAAVASVLPSTDAAPAAPDEPWPDALATVAELVHPGLEGVARVMGGPLYFFVGWLGLLLLLLPRRDWRPAHFAVLIAGTLLYRLLLAFPELGRAPLVALVALPLGVALVVSVWDERDNAERGTRLLVVVWFLATLFLAWVWMRFTFLLVAPFALSFGVAIGRVLEWVESLATARRPALAPAVRVAGWLVVGAVLLPPLRQGVAAADSYVPRMQGAWWDTLTRLRRETPADAIVVAWWDYGYFVEYVAERRSAADGGTLLTHVPHWIARVLLASSEPESVGLLRMLACGSDATPEAEGALGAWGKLVAHGVDGAAAHQLIIALAGLDRAAAERRLRASGLDAAAADDVLHSTHCTPPATYLVLSSAQMTSTVWMSLGSWGPGAEQPFLAGDATPCRADEHGERVCAVRAALPDALVDRFVYPADDPAAGRFVLAPADGGPSRETAPAVILLASGGQVQTIKPAGAGSSIGVLLDLDGARALVGAAAALRSTFVRLMFLGEAPGGRFHKVDDRTGYGGERVVTWRVDYSVAFNANAGT